MRTAIPLAFCVAGLAASTGCNKPGKVQDHLAKGEQAYQQKRYDVAVAELTAYIDGGGKHLELPRALYLRGLAQTRAGNRTGAKADLQRAASGNSPADIRWRAQSQLGTLAYEDGQWRQAAEAYAGAAQDAPRAPPTDLILFRLGTCYERLGQWPKSRQLFERLVREFPKSSVAADAQRRLQLKPDHFAIQCGVFADAKNADYLVTQLGRDGIQATVRREPRGGVMSNVVVVGRMQNYEEALRELSRVKGYVPNAVLWP